MDLRLGTNGLLLDRAASQSLIDAGLTRLEVSIDAHRPETYRKIRRGGRLETVRDNVFRFLDLRRRAGADFPVLRISFLNLPQNQSERGDFLDFWRPHADLFSIQEPIYFERAPISRDVNLVQGPVPHDFRCAQPNQRLIVRADGTAYPCCSIYGLDMPAGSAADRPLADIWTNTLLTGLRGQNANRRHRDNPICAHCADRSYLTAVEPNTDKETPHVR
jgi:radical SAM protein with 4Fe4S-binding SPASM domain